MVSDKNSEEETMTHIKELVQLDRSFLRQQITREQVRVKQRLLTISEDQITIGTVSKVIPSEIVINSSKTWRSRLPEGLEADYYLLPKPEKLFSKERFRLPEIADAVTNKFQELTASQLEVGLDVLYFLNDRMLVLSSVEQFTDEKVFMESGKESHVSHLMVPHVHKPLVLDEMPNLQRLLAKIDAGKQ